MDIHTEKCHRHQCDFCEKTLRDKKGLLEHLRKIHESKYQCNGCDEIFNTEKKLFRHFEQVHSAEKVCPHCNGKFKNIRVLRKHIKKSCKKSKSGDGDLKSSNKELIDLDDEKPPVPIMSSLPWICSKCHVGTDICGHTDTRKNIPVDLLSDQDGTVHIVESFHRILYWN